MKLKRQILMFTMAFVIAISHAVAQVDVTFSVDMTAESVSADGVHLVGSLNGWTADANPLSDEDEDGIYEVTMSLDAGDYEFKFLNGNAWGAPEDAPTADCAFGGSANNRLVSVGSDDLILPTVTWGGCGFDGIDVEFQVDMTGETVTTMYMTGSLFGWSETGYPMTQVDASDIYTITKKFMTPGATMEFKFLNGGWGGQETPGTLCSFGSDANNRLFTVPDAGLVLPTMPFNGCADGIEVKYSVDMAAETVHTNGVFITGSLFGWSGSNYPLALETGTTYAITKSFLTGGDHMEFKFLNGGFASDEIPGEETPGTACAFGGDANNRLLTVPSVDTDLSVITFGGCSEGIDVTFSVDMRDQTINESGVYITGDIFGWNAENYPMVEESEGVYVITKTFLTAGTDVQYKFLNGQGYGEDNANLETPGEACSNASNNREISVSTSTDQVYESEFNGCGVNAAPTTLTLTGDEISESQPEGTEIGVFSTDDTDEDEITTYELVDTESFPDNTSFTISDDQLLSAEEFDFETKTSYSIKVRATDSGGETIEDEFTIDILDVAPSFSAIIVTPSEVDEGNNESMSFELSATSEGDASDAVFEKVEGGTDNDAFSLSGSTLTFAGTFDFETKSEYNLRIEVSGGEFTPLTDDLVITVLDVAEVPTDITLSHNEIQEGLAAGSVVGELDVVDADLDEVHILTLVSGEGDTDNASFDINENGELITTTVLSYDDQSSYSVRIQADDQREGTYSEAFEITVLLVNETPGNLTLSTNEVAEDVPVGTLVGVLNAEDDGESLTYTLVSGEGDTGNEAFAINGAGLVTNATLDFETTASYSIRVKVDDGRSGELEQNFTIIVTDVEEVTLDLEGQNVSVAIYPNPASQWVSVQGVSAQVELQLISLHGELIQHTFGEKNMNIQGLNAGMYILRVFDQKNTTTTRLLIEK